VRLEATPTAMDALCVCVHVRCVSACREGSEVVLLPDEKTWIKQKEEKFAAKAKQEANERAAARAALREEAAAARATTREPGSQPSSRPGSPPHEESSKHGKGGKSGAPPKPAMVKAESLVENEGGHATVSEKADNETRWRPQKFVTKKGMAGWSPFTRSIGEFFLQAGVPNGVEGELFNLSARQVEQMIASERSNQRSCDTHHPLMGLAMLGVWVMQTLAHHTINVRLRTHGQHAAVPCLSAMPLGDAFGRCRSRDVR
jgi:hypothetical protein